jgi:hypothetical protein
MTAERVRITEIDVGASIDHNETDAHLKPLVIAPIPAGGSRVAWMGTDSKVYVSKLDASDQVTGAAIGFDAEDFGDLYADDAGGAIFLTRPKECGSSDLLCGAEPKPTDPCFDLFLVRFEESGAESWAARLSTDTTPYEDGSVFAWWYGHHGRIAWTGSEYAVYFGMAVTVANNSCNNESTGTNGGNDIHQSDENLTVSPAGVVGDHAFNGFCSHTGYNRLIWDAEQSRYAAVCKTDNQNRILYNGSAEVRGVDLWYSNLGNLVAANGGYWLTASDIEPGETANSEGNADVRLLFFTPPNGGGDASLDQDLDLAVETGVNERAPHLARYGSDRLLAAWESSSEAGDLSPHDQARKLFVQTRNLGTGAAEGEPLEVDVLGSRYQDFVAFPDGSVAYAAPGSSASKIKIVRILPCSE